METMRGVTATHTERTRQCEGSGGDGEMILQTEGHQSHQKRGARTVCRSLGRDPRAVCGKQAKQCVFRINGGGSKLVKHINLAKS